MGTQNPSPRVLVPRFPQLFRQPSNRTAEIIMNLIFIDPICMYPEEDLDLASVFREVPVIELMEFCIEVAV